ncbi:SusD/RagB family nutrient-binding outer membrane lipoprotein [Pedobacter sp. Du54]|uniref:SusD/RagB family nutrient-binding outer membrane lipoprotein n=1 Tax=Pedobacter anseongensis TaxID=3133439 RepID=UPI0030A425C7
MKYIRIICLFIMLFSASGCKKWLDVNTDPATPQTSRAEFYLAPIIARMAMSTAQDYRDAQFKFTQGIMAQTSLNVFERHGFAASDVGGMMWRFVYIDAGLNLEDMLTKGNEQGAFGLVGIGYAIKAWGFQFLTDSHGPIILDEAYKDQLTFGYQDQPEVYAKVREWCQLALVNLNKTDVGDYSTILRNNDFLFQGDRDKWKKFVYAILAQQYSHLTNKPEFASKYADSVVKYADLSFASAAEDAAISFNGNTSADANPNSVLGGYLSATTTGRIGQPIVNYLTGGVRGVPPTSPTSSIDPRLTRMINPMVTTSTATNGVYRGVVATKGDVPTTKTIPSVYGSAVNTASAPYPGKYLFGQGTSTVDKPKYLLFSYAQMQFAKAEALFIKGDKAGAYTAYRNGITGHMNFVNLYGLNGVIKAPAITSAEITAYMASSEVAQSAGDLTIADIMGQKYIAQWGWAGQEQWCDMRKYHYDPLVFKQFKPLESSEFYPTTVGKYAYRIRPRYNSEYLWNRAELERLGAYEDDYTTKETWFSLP